MIPSSSGNTPYAVRLGTASGTPTTVNVAMVASTTPQAGHRTIDPIIAIAVPSAIAKTASTTKLPSR